MEHPMLCNRCAAIMRLNNRQFEYAAQCGRTVARCGQCGRTGCVQRYRPVRREQEREGEVN